MMQLTPSTSPFGEVYYPELNGRAFENQPSALLYDKHLKHALEKPGVLYVIVGTDGGLLVNYVVARFLGEGRRFLFLDQPEVIEAIESRRWDLDERVVLQALPYQFDLIRATYADYAVRQSYELRSSFSVIDKIGDYEALYQQAASDFWAFHFANRSGMIERQFIDMQLRVVTDLVKPIRLLKDTLKDRSVLLLGGGPSLDGVMPWIKTHQQGLIIFAAGRIVERLIDEGVRIDFVVSVDPHELSFDNSKHLLKLSANTVLLTGHHPNQRLIKQWPYLSAYAGKALPWKFNTDTERNPGAPGPTVMNAAFFFAVFMGASRIFMAGVDFCFSATGDSHESGSQEVKAGVSVDPKNMTARLKTYAGYEAQTSTDYDRARHTLQQQIAVYFHPENYPFQVFNLSPSAAVTQGVEYIELAAAAKLLTPDLTWQSAVFAPLGETLTERHQRLLKIQKSLQDLAARVRDVLKRCDEAQRLNRTQADLAKRALRLARIKDKIQKAMAPDDDLLFAYAPSAFHEFLQPMDTAARLSDEQVCQSLTLFIEASQTGAQQLELTLEKTLTDFQIALMEVEPFTQKGFEQLVAAWQKHNIPGRFKVWLERQGWDSESFCQTQTHVCEALHRDFEHQFSSQALANSPMHRRIQTRKNDPLFYLGMINKAHELQSIEWLDKVIANLERLEPDKNSHDFTALADYALALRSLLEGKHEEGVAQLESIKHPNLRLTVLKRLLSLHMDAHNHEKTLEVLQELIPYNDEYVVNFADLIALLGNKMDAISLYEQFVNKYTSRTDVWWKMARLLAELNEVQLAKEVCEKILSIHPEHLLAKQMLAKIAPTT